MNKDHAPLLELINNKMLSFLLDGDAKPRIGLSLEFVGKRDDVNVRN